MKIACLGAGGLYFQRVFGDIAVCPDLRGSDMALYDIDEDRCRMMAEVGQRFSREAGADLRVAVARSLSEAVEGADFVVASIGGTGASGSKGYSASPIHVNDCVIAAKYGVPQIVGDTGGPAAMAAAFRSVPIYLDICREIERRAPEATLINHANPMAVLCRAMVKYTGVRSVIGLCHGVQGGIGVVADLLQVPPQELDCIWIGTNHYYWFTRIRLRGKDVMPEVIKLAKERADPAHELANQLSRIYGYRICYPKDDHLIEFYPFMAQARDLAALPEGLREAQHMKDLMPFYTGEENVAAYAAECAAAPREQVLADYAEELSKARLPERVDDRVTGEGLARLIAGIAFGRRTVCILNVPNAGSVSNLPAEALIETECVTDPSGCRPICTGEAPQVLKGMLEKRFAWQECVADAAVKGDCGMALQAMMLDETAILPKQSEAMLDELLENSRGMLPQFG